ncbi:hypothetical protein AB4059_15030 [Lysobacter sp. 2RAF19]
MDDWNVKNPASWLVTVWDRMPRDSSTIHAPALVGWAATFGLKKHDISVFEALASVAANVDLAVELVRRLNAPEKKKEQLTTWQDAFRNGVSPAQSGNQWSNVLQYFTPDRKVHLDYCSTELDVAIPSSASIGQVRDHASMIESLITSLEADDSIDAEFKHIVHDLLEALRRALAEYETRGQKGVLDSMGFIFATLLRYKDLFDTPGKQRWGAKLRQALSVAADVATVTGVTALTLNSTLGGFLPGTV